MRMVQKLEQAKALILGGSSYKVAATTSGFGHEIELYKALKDDPDIVAAKASGQLKTRSATTRTTKGPDHYARKPYVQAVLNGMTQTEAAAKYGVSQPLVGRHLKLAGGMDGAAKEAPPTPPPPDVTLIADLIRSLAAKAGVPAKALLERVAAVL